MSARSDRLVDLIDAHGRANIGYSQGRRWSWLDKSGRKIIPGKAGDCSAVTLGLLWLAGYPIDSKWIAGSLSAWTGNFRDIAVSAGLRQRSVSGMTVAQINALAKPGDSLLKSGHVMIRARDGRWYSFNQDENGNLTGGRDGDQTGKESSLLNLWPAAWTYLLILPDHAADSGGAAEPVPAQQSTVTPPAGLTGGVTLVENAATNVHSGPSTAYEVIGSLGPNIQVTGTVVGSWLKIVTPEARAGGYVAMSTLYDVKTTLPPEVDPTRPVASTIEESTDPLLRTNPIDGLNVSPQFAAAVTSRWARRVSVASLWRGPRCIVPELPLVADSSKIAVGSDSPVRRRADLTFSAGRFGAHTVRDLLEMPGVTLRVETGFDLGGRIETVPVFESSVGFSVSSDTTSGTVRVDAPDRMEMVSRYGFESPFWSVVGASAAGLMQAVIQEASPGARLVDLTGSTFPMPDLFWDASDTGRIDACTALAQAMGAELFKSPVAGVWVLRPMVAPGSQSARWVVKAGRDLVSSSRTIDKGRIVNTITAESQRADMPMERAVWIDSDPDSATGTAVMGPRMAPIIRTSIVTDPDALLALAAAAGARVKGSLLDLDWSMLLNPLMEPGDTVRVETPDHAYECVLDSFEIPLGAQRVSSGKARALKLLEVAA